MWSLSYHSQVGLGIMAISILVIFILTATGIGRAMLTLLSPSLMAIAVLMPLIGYSLGYVIPAILRLSKP